MFRRSGAVAAAVWIAAALAAPAAAGDGLPTPLEFSRTAWADASQYMGGEHITGESFCWHAAFYLRTFVRGYRATADTAWLDAGVTYYDHLVEAMAAGPDGRRGWIGPFIYDKRVWCDVHVGDSVLAAGLLEFAELVLKDPQLKSRYGAKADSYVRLAAVDVIEKWDRRGTWREDGPYGAYVSWDQYGEPGDFTHWTDRPDVKKSGLSLPFNKQNDMALVCLRLYRITGEKAYRDKAEKIFSFMRSRFQFFDDHYVWNYWEPFGPWDIDADKGDTVHWMGVHPYRNYQAGEIGQIVEAYHTGVVFTKTDIQRIINTNLKVMWNGDRAEPKFRNSNATVPGYRPARPSARYPGKAGTLWTALADFDPTIRQLRADALAAGRGSMNALNEAYFKKVVCAAPPSFKRKYVADPPAPPEFLTSESSELIVAAAVPARFKAGRTSYLVCKAYVPGRARITLRSADGATEKAVLYDGPIKNPLIRPFDGRLGDGEKGKTALEGDFRIRWTFKDGYREFPITILR